MDVAKLLLEKGAVVDAKGMRILQSHILLNIHHTFQIIMVKLLLIGQLNLDMKTLSEPLGMLLGYIKGYRDRMNKDVMNKSGNKSIHNV